jgi:hypothetical protein
MVVAAIRAAIASLPDWSHDILVGLPLHQAAAALWAAEPWEFLPNEGATATIVLGEPINTRLHASAVQVGSLAGVMFFLDDEDFLRMVGEAADGQEADPHRGIDDLPSLQTYNSLLVMFQDNSDADDDDIDVAEIDHAASMRWPIGSGSAYPRFVRTGDADGLRRISDSEARILTLAMDALARYCMREDVRSAEGDSAVEAEVWVRDADQLIAASVVSPAGV